MANKGGTGWVGLDITKQTVPNQYYAPKHSGAVNRRTGKGGVGDNTLFITITIVVVIY